MIVPPTIGIQVERPDFPPSRAFPVSGVQLQEERMALIRLQRTRSLQPVPSSIAIFDLDRVLVRGGSGRVIASMARQSGLVSRELPNSDVFYSLIDAFGDNIVVMAAARQLPLVFKGKQKSAVQFGASLVAPDLTQWVQEYAAKEIADHKAAGRGLVLATAMPAEIARPIANKLGFTAVVATEFGVDADGKFNGEINGNFVWADGKRAAIEKYASENDVDLKTSWMYSDSRNDIAVMELVGNPIAVNPDQRLERHAREQSWTIVRFEDANPGDSLIPDRAEAQRIAFKVLRPEMLPFADGLDSVDPNMPAILVAEAKNSFDYVALALTVAAIGRPVGFVRKEDLVEDLVGSLASGEMQVATGAPWDTVIAAAKAAGAAIYAVRVTGSDAVWPRDKPLPAIWNLRNPPAVTCEVTGPLDLKFRSASADAARIESATA